jgi:hypothetical protein
VPSAEQGSAAAEQNGNNSHGEAVNSFCPTEGLDQEAASEQKAVSPLVPRRPHEIDHISAGLHVLLTIHAEWWPRSSNDDSLAERGVLSDVPREAVG